MGVLFGPHALCWCVCKCECVCNSVHQFPFFFCIIIQTNQTIAHPKSAANNPNILYRRKGHERRTDRKMYCCRLINDQEFLKTKQNKPKKKKTTSINKNKWRGKKNHRKEIEKKLLLYFWNVHFKVRVAFLFTSLHCVEEWWCVLYLKYQTLKNYGRTFVTFFLVSLLLIFFYVNLHRQKFSSCFYNSTNMQSKYESNPKRKKWKGKDYNWSWKKTKTISTKIKEINGMMLRLTERKSHSGYVCSALYNTNLTMKLIFY